MSTELEAFIAQLRDDKNPPTVEEATCQGVVLPILGRLGWNRDNVREVVPQFQIGSDRVDYCLKIESKCCAFIEVKRYGEPLDAHQEQLLKYAFKQGVGLAILTNGSAWWFYLPSLEASWEQRKFYAIDILEQEVELVVRAFRQFLSRDAIQDGSALLQAKEVYKSKEKQRIIERTIPDAWTKLCQEQDDLLVDLIADKVESLCGHKPDPSAISRFLQSTLSSAQPLRDKGPLPPTRRGSPPVVPPSNHPSIKQCPNGVFTFSRPTSFAFHGSTYAVRKWNDVLLTLCRIMYEKHRDFEEKCRKLNGRTRTFISQTTSHMAAPREIPGTHLYVETNYSANSIVGKCRDLIRAFGYPDSDLTIEAVQKK
jgi:hypothetical protein